jgi:hypothetical protein
MNDLYKKALAFGIVEEMEVYNTRREDFFTSHKFIDFCDDPPKAKIKKEFPAEAALLGTAFHTAMLEPEKFEKTYTVMPRLEDHPDLSEYKNKKNTKIYRQLKAEWLADNEGKEVLDRDQLHTLKCQSSAYAEQRLLHSLLEDTIQESTFMTDLDLDGDHLKAQIRPDLLNFTSSHYEVYDLKTIDNIEMWWRHVTNFGYQIQLWFYAYVLESILGEPPKHLRIVFVEKSEPNRTQIVEVEPFLWVGPVKSFIHKNLLSYKEAKKTNKFKSKFGNKIENYINTKELE